MVEAATTCTRPIDDWKPRERALPLDGFVKILEYHKGQNSREFSRRPYDRQGRRNMRDGHSNSTALAIQTNHDVFFILSFSSLLRSA